MSGQLQATDVDGDTLTFSLITAMPSSEGTVSVQGNGGFSFTPAANFNGQTSFTFKANDGTVDSNTATVTIDITPVNDPPVAQDGAGSVPEDGVLSGLLPIDTNTGDVDGDALTFSLVAPMPSSEGIVTMAVNGSFSFVPAPDFNGQTSFTFKANDGNLDSNTATFVITVTPVNDAPVANDDTATTLQGTALDIEVLGNDTDADGDTLAVVSLLLIGTDGSVSVNPDGTVRYTPSATFTGTDTFQYSVFDGTTGSNTATVTVTVLPATATIDSLINQVKGLGLPKGLENSLTSKLQAAKKSVGKGNVKAAKNQLRAFINAVRAQRGKKLTNAQADALIAAAEQVIIGL